MWCGLSESKEIKVIDYRRKGDAIMQITEGIIILLYLLFMTIIGIYFYRRVISSESDYCNAVLCNNTFVAAFAILAPISSSKSLMVPVGSGVILVLPYYIT